MIIEAFQFSALLCVAVFALGWLLSRVGDPTLDDAAKEGRE